jgi:hypothetical protein
MGDGRSPIDADVPFPGKESVVSLQLEHKPLTQEQRMEVFRVLVQAQDRGLSVSASRAAVGQRYRLSDVQLLRIEQEGLDAEWPPL